MKDNVLKKEFQKRDVERLRNLVKGKHGDRTTVGIGYNGEVKEDHKEGDVWEENNKTWTIKNGIKMTVTKLDIVRKALQTPLTCPNCGQPMNKGRLDKIMYSIHKQCSDCVIKFETKLKIEGKFEEYQQNINKQSIEYHITEMENVLLELALNQSEESFVTEAGDIEAWKGKGVDNAKLIQDIQEYIQKLKDVVSS